MSYGPIWYEMKRTSLKEDRTCTACQCGTRTEHSSRINYQVNLYWCQPGLYANLPAGEDNKVHIATIVPCGSFTNDEDLNRVQVETTGFVADDALAIAVRYTLDEKKHPLETMVDCYAYRDTIEKKRLEFGSKIVSDLVRELAIVSRIFWARDRAEHLYNHNIKRPTLPKDHYFYNPDVEKMTEVAEECRDENIYRSLSFYLKSLPILKRVDTALKAYWSAYDEVRPGPFEKVTGK